MCRRPVFWLPDQRSPRPSQTRRPSGNVEVRSPVTAAGPRRIRTGFPKTVSYVTRTVPRWSGWAPQDRGSRPATSDLLRQLRVGVLRGAAGAHRGGGDDRGGNAQDLPDAPSAVGATRVRPLDRPTPARVVDLHREKAWPFVVWAAVSRRLRVDVELLLANRAASTSRWCGTASTPARSSGRSQWVKSSVGAPTRYARSLATACRCCARGLARGLDELSDADLAAFRAEAEAAPHLSESARTRARTRLFAVGQICFQLGSASAPPRRGVAEARAGAGPKPGTARRGCCARAGRVGGPRDLSHPVPPRRHRRPAGVLRNSVVCSKVLLRGA